MAKLKDATQALPPQPLITSSSLVSSSSSPRQESEAVTTHDQFGTGQWPGKDGRSWEIFTRNKGGKTIYPSGTAIEEEDENEPSSTPRNGNQEILDNPRDYLESPQGMLILSTWVVVILPFARFGSPRRPNWWRSSICSDPDRSAPGKTFPRCRLRAKDFIGGPTRCPRAKTANRWYAVVPRH
jgi:hypothetical protein